VSSKKNHLFFIPLYRIILIIEILPSLLGIAIPHVGTERISGIHNQVRSRILWLFSSVSIRKR